VSDQVSHPYRTTGKIIVVTLNSEKKIRNGDDVDDNYGDDNGDMYLLVEGDLDGSGSELFLLGGFFIFGIQT
jgi:hypothetical protein